MSHFHSSENGMAAHLVTLKIDQEGDIYLDLDGYRLLVSAKALSLASTVFKSMFDPRFAEGTRISQANPGCVLLPEDNAEAMIALCYILHHRSQNVSETLSLALFEKLAIVADKYNSVSSLTQWSANVLTKTLRTTPRGIDQGRLVFPAFVFDIPSAFMKITKHMVYSLAGGYEGIFKAWVEESNHDIKAMLPDIVIQKAQDIRIALQENVEAVIAPLLRKPLNGAPYRAQTARRERSHDAHHISECDCTKVMLYLEALDKKGLWPLTSAFKRKTLDQIMSDLDSCSFQNSTAISSNCSTCAMDLQAEVGKCVEAARKAFGGLCLDCVHFSSNTSKWKTCRIPHTGFLEMEGE